MIDGKGYGPRIRQLALERASQIGRRYPDVEFARDIGMAERGRPYSNTTLSDWISERNEPGFGSMLAMEVVLERPGAAVYIVFGIWPNVATPGAVVQKPRAPAPDPRKARGASTAAPKKRATGRR